MLCRFFLYNKVATIRHIFGFVAKRSLSISRKRLFPNLIRIWKHCIHLFVYKLHGNEVLWNFIYIALHKDYLFCSIGSVVLATYSFQTCGEPLVIHNE